MTVPRFGGAFCVDILAPRAYSHRMNMSNMLIELGWSKAELARRLGVYPSTVTNWRDMAPRYALAYLELALKLKQCGDMVR